MDITDAILDTNVLYQPKELRAIVERGGVRLWGSVANVIEIVGDIVDSGTFSASRSQLRTLEEVAPRPYLPDPDNLFKYEMGFPASFDDALQWKEHVAKPIIAAER